MEELEEVQSVTSICEREREKVVIEEARGAGRVLVTEPGELVSQASSLDLTIAPWGHLLYFKRYE